MSKFSLGALMVTVSLAAFCIWLSRETWLAGFLLALAIVQAVLANRLGNKVARSSKSTKPSLWLVTRATLAISAVIAAWFALVDCADISWQCSKCGCYVERETIRLGGVVLWTKRATDVESTVSRLHADLGYPCKHAFTSKVLERDWGMLALPKPEYTICIPPPPIYAESESAKARQFGLKHPEEARKVLEAYADSQDFEVIFKFISKLKYEDW